MIIDCKTIATHHLYKLLIGSVLPRPIAWVSSQSADGQNNLAPFSFFNVFSVAPPVLGFAPGYKKAAPGATRPPKDTLRNVMETGEFVVNIVSRELAEKMNQTSGDYAEDVSEFDVTGLTIEPSQKVKPTESQRVPGLNGMQANADHRFGGEHPRIGRDLVDSYGRIRLQR